MSRVIGVFSAKGGVGKTTTAINLASALNEFGRIVVLVDTDITSPNLGMYLGNHDIPISLHKVLKGEANIHDAVYTHHSGLHIIFGSVNPNEVDTIDYKKINDELEKLKGKYEIILIDSAPGRFEETIRDMNFITSIVVITTPELVAVTDALRTITIAKQFGKEILGVVLTRTGSHEHEMTEENISTMLNTKILACIPEDKNIPLSARASSPVVRTHPESDASVAYKKLAAKLLGSSYEKIEKRDNVFDYMVKNLGLK